MKPYIRGPVDTLLFKAGIYMWKPSLWFKFSFAKLIIFVSLQLLFLKDKQINRHFMMLLLPKTQFNTVIQRKNKK